MAGVERTESRSRPDLHPTRCQPPTRPRPTATSILLVEDDPYCRTAIRRMLVLMGFEVCEAAHGLEALCVLARRRVDAVLTDVVMPVMDGIMFYRRVRENHPGLPVVVYTGGHSVSDASRLDIVHARRSAFLAKPFLPDDLASALRGVLDDDEG